MKQIKTVKIFSQEWMSENLNVDTYRNGDPIFQANTDEKWEKFSNQEKGCWRWYGDDAANGKKYGKMYNWYAINDPRGLAPVGYRVGSFEDWERLIDNLGGGDDEIGAEKLLSRAGFSASLGGFGYYDVEDDKFMSGITEAVIYWTTTEWDGPRRAKVINIILRPDLDLFSTYNFSSLAYVRCIKDNNGQQLDEPEAAEDDDWENIDYGDEEYSGERDDLFEDAARIIVQHQKGSISFLQRKLKLGYERAGSIIDQLEEAGIVGEFEGSNDRKVLIADEDDLEELLNNLI